MLPHYKYCIISLLLVLLGVPITAQAQVTVISVKALSEKGNYEWEGVVDSVTAFNPEFQKLVAQLNNAQARAINTQTATTSDNAMKGSQKALAELEKVKGMITEAEYQKAKAEILKAQQQAQQTEQNAESGKGVSNPAALKEQIRQYCVGKRFYRRVCDEVKGVRRVDVGSYIDGGSVDVPRYRGFINSLGQILVEPDRYSDFNLGISIGGMSFNTEDKAIAHIRSIDGKPSSACMIDNRGRVLLSGDYPWLSFFMDCHLLQAANPQQKYGIIDYNGNVLEPFIHNDPNADELYKAKNRIMKEKDWTAIKLF